MEKKHKRWKNRSVMISWIVSYIIILVIPIIAFSIVSAILYNIISNEVIVANQKQIEEMRDMLDYRLEETVRFSNNLYSDQSLQLLFPLRMPMDANTRYSLWNVSTKLNREIKNNDIVSSGYLYLLANEQSLYNGSIYDFDLLMKELYGDVMLDTDAWRNELKLYHFNQFRVVQHNNKGSQVMLLSSVPVMPMYDMSATLVLVLNINFYLEKITEMHGYESSTFILLDEENRIIASNQNIALPDQIKYNQLVYESGNMICTINSKQYIAYYTSSNRTGWKYISLTPLELMKQRYNCLRSCMVVAIIISMVLGLFISYWMAKKKFNFINELLNKLKHGKKQSSGMANNEYKQIEELLDDVLRNSDKLNQIVEIQQLMIQKNILQQLLCRISNISNLSESSLINFGLNFRYSFFMVIILFLNETMDTNMDTIDNDQLLFDCADTLRQCCTDWCDCYPLIIDGKVVLLLNLQHNRLSNKEEAQIINSMDEIRDSQQKHQRILSISLSTIYEGILNIHKAFEEAVEWVGYAQMVPHLHAKVYSSKRVAGRVQKNFGITSMQEELLSAAISAGNAAAAVKLVKEICIRYFQDVPVDQSITRCFLYDIAAIPLKIVIDTRAKAVIEEGISTMEMYTDTWKMQQTLQDIIEQCCIIQHDANTLVDHTLLDDILVTFNEHYTETDFNIARLAQLLNRNISYLSKYFKDNTGVGLYDYLNRMRINKAKELIMSSKAPISQLIQQAGFENPGSFIRVFKRYEGMTPGTYKKKVNTNNDK